MMPELSFFYAWPWGILTSFYITGVLGTLIFGVIGKAVGWLDHALPQGKIEWACLFIWPLIILVVVLFEILFWIAGAFCILTGRPRKKD